MSKTTRSDPAIRFWLWSPIAPLKETMNNLCNTKNIVKRNGQRYVQQKAKWIVRIRPPTSEKAKLNEMVNIMLQRKKVNKKGEDDTNWERRHALIHYNFT